MTKNLVKILSVAILLLIVAVSCKKDVKVTGVQLDQTALTLAVDKTATLTATVAPADADNKNVTWTSSDPLIATVADGIVTAKKVGVATITVTTEEGGYTAKCVVTVTETENGVTGVSLDKTNITLNVDETATLTATVVPADADNKNVTWTSSDPLIATVANGIVTAKKEGTATITVTTEEGGYKATCAVTVTPTAGVTISGITWATCNVDAPGTFAANPEDAGMFYQWNRKVGWPATGNITNFDVSYPNMSMEWERDNNPCPPGWRVPGKDELSNLHNSGSTWGQLNGVNGRYYGSGDEKIFLPAVGYRNVNGTHSHNGTEGDYWAADCRDYGSSSGSSYYLLFSNINSQGAGYYADRRCAFSVRCVKVSAGSDWK